MKKSKGFGAVSRGDARVLILGSLPGRMSLERGEYYAQPRNAFWPIMRAVVGFEAGATYEERLDALRRAGVALWDVCAAGQREGSLDSAIREVEANDFAAFFGSHRAIERVCFNGAKAEELFERHVRGGLGDLLRGVTMLRLPSTSPAHAAMGFERKLDAWRSALSGSLSR